MTFFLVLLVPVVISTAAFFLLHESVTWKEFLLQLGLGAAFCVAGWQLTKWGALRDTEHLNGRITEKVDGTQKCCHCRDVCDAHNKKGECTSSHEVCDHFSDNYWDLKTTVGTISIESCSTSSSPPSVWTNAKVGEPAAVAHGYTNYLLADPDSLMVHADIVRYADQVPEYPNIHSKYRVNHVIGDQPSSIRLQEAFREINADLGAPNQVDITLLLTSVPDPTYAQAVEAKWLYGPKNSLTIVAGLDSNRTVKWIRVVTFSKVEMLRVRLRDNLQGLPIDDPRFYASVRQEVQQGFKRTSMADFAYLASTASPQGWHLALLLFVEALLSLALAVWAHAKDIFGDERARVFSGYSAPLKRRKI